MTSDKKDGGTIINWELHELSVPVQMADELGYEIQTENVFILTGIIKNDPTGRWGPGWYIRSSIVTAYDLNVGWVETQNTFYKIEGPSVPLTEITPELI